MKAPNYSAYSSSIPYVKYAGNIDDTIKLTFFSWLFLKNDVKLHNKEIKKRFLVLFTSNSLKSVLAKPFHMWYFIGSDYQKIVSFLLLKNILISAILILVLCPEKNL